MENITMLINKLDSGLGEIPGFVDKTTNIYRDQKERYNILKPRLDKICLQFEGLLNSNQIYLITPIRTTRFIRTPK